MKRRGFLVRALAGVLGLFGVGRVKAGGLVAADLCDGCDAWPPLCDRCKHGGFLIPNELTPEQLEDLRTKWESRYKGCAGLTSEILGTRRVFAYDEDGNEERLL